MQGPEPIWPMFVSFIKIYFGSWILKKYKKSYQSTSEFQHVLFDKYATGNKVVMHGPAELPGNDYVGRFF